MQFNDPAVQVALPPAKDQTSLDYGNGDGFSLCGPQTYEISNISGADYSSFMTFDGVKTLEFEATDKNDIGDHTVTVRASLTNYPEIDPIESIVEVSIQGCIVSTLFPGASSDETFEYDLVLSQ